MDRAHARHVAAGAMEVFRSLGHLHGMTKTSRNLVEVTALLHDIAESAGKRHDLAGAARLRRTRLDFIPREWQEFMAEATSLHSNKSDIESFLRRRKKSKDPGVELTARLAAVLRIGDGLDHERKQDTQIAGIVDDGKVVTIYVSPSENANSNADFALSKADLWNKVALRPIKSIEVAKDGPPCVAWVSPAQPVRTALAAILRRQFEQMVSREYGLPYEQDVEYVHEMRVAMRRAMAAMEALGKNLRGAKSLAKETAKFADALGDVRDLDVLLEYLEEYAQKAPKGHKADLEKIIAHQRLVKRRHHAQAVKKFSSAGYRRFKKLYQDVVGSPDSRPARRKSQEAWRHARQAMLQSLGKIFKYPSPGKLKRRQQHKLRIAFKDLRYLAEFFRGFYSQRLGKVIDACVDMQDALGMMHDMKTYIRRLRDEKVPGVRPDAPAMTALIDDMQSVRQACLRDAIKVWRKTFGSGSDRRRLINLLKRPEIS